MKSPKGDKKGKTKTTWDPFKFGGQGATGEEAKSLERGPKSPKPGANGEDEIVDHHMKQFVPDASVIGNSSSKSCLLFRTTLHNFPEKRIIIYC